MIGILVAGALSVFHAKLEVFPEIDTDTITIQVPYRGATPADAEEGVCIRVEEAIASIEGIKRLRSSAMEGLGTVTAELYENADDQKVLDDVKAAVDRIETFPAETEKPVVALADTRRRVITVAVFGDATEKTLKAIAEHIRDDLTAKEGISQVEISGVRRYEISIEVSEDALRRYGLSFQQVAAAVRLSSLDLPGGAVKTHGGEILLRTKGQMYHGEEFENITLITRPDGTRLLLSDVATVIDGFEDSDTASLFDGKPAALIQVYRVGDEDALSVADITKEYLNEVGPTLPTGISVATWDDDSIILRQRIGLLLRNARLGLILVFLCLVLFLDLRLAIWATMGIPISFLGGLWLAPYFGVSINMVSLFAFIIVLGIVVDDAIVVGENIFSYLEQGIRPIDAAIQGVRDMAVPVTFAVITTIAAFAPILFVSGMMGKVMKQIPIIVIAVLSMSLLEALIILPAHLSGRKLNFSLLSGLLSLLEPIQRRAQKGLDWVIRGPYHTLLELALEWRYATVSLAVSILLLVLGLVASGYLKFTLMPKVDADNMVAFLTMPQGTPVEVTEGILAKIERAAQEIAAEVDEEDPDDEHTLIQHTSLTVGQKPSQGAHGPMAQRNIGGSSSNIGEVNIELLGSDVRTVSSNHLVNLWRDRVGEVPGAVNLTFQSSMFSGGDAISVQLAHHSFPTLLKAVTRLEEAVSGYPGVKDVGNSFLLGKRELELQLTVEGRTLGLTLSDLGRQVRAAFYGEEAQRIQRGRDDVRVMVRYPESDRKSLADIENMRIRLPNGAEAPFTTVARVTEGRSYATINRTDRRRVVTVTADVDAAVANANEINQELRTSVLPGLVRDFPGLVFSFEGEQRNQQESMGSLKTNFIVAQLAIFALLAIPFRSYLQPLIVMSAIPFGLVGAVVGHVIMGYDLSLLSVFGMVALTGVVVNDSLIMVDLINRERARNISLDQAIRDSGTRRFRPIMLTTATTFLGLSPMILETSLQARFLIPMAISLGFGIVFATTITLILVPVLYRILADLRLFLGIKEHDDDDFGDISTGELKLDETGDMA
jgi:multidrug efflux pump subunit AcrB